MLPTVVLLDIRAYSHRPELAEVRERLQQFCRSGGVDVPQAR